jgi:hypothetical protein
MRNFSMPNWVSYIPHASKQLNQTTVSEGGTNDDIRVAETKRAKIDQAE